ncbi:hypothetical protein GLAREA_07996 [Glarea lozoyensis ATCC 20868]|uniref:Uncharacterized protein n=1 Tax=Glarea lozoyensis (strain ATCC 20868 / MF5171) TaxID=1116229 RepID=S3CWE9_GLAL2|nr:uncharacterized protein GLAREA_07996 [Glarea lozoyensis ATCC 20868]EPE24146.1 hypothetical protein GLAREA_07996 [Glarea lozoyensis ATCC 20868]
MLDLIADIHDYNNSDNDKIIVQTAHLIISIAHLSFMLVYKWEVYLDNTQMANQCLSSKLEIALTNATNFIA